MNRIVVGVDGSESSMRALSWAVEEARWHGASIRAVHVWQAHYHYPSVSLLSAALSVVTPEALERAAQHTLDECVAGVDTSGVDVERVLVQGGAARELIAAGKGADLLVVGTRGRGGFAGMLLGSVSHHVTHHAPCPVVVIPVTP